LHCVEAGHSFIDLMVQHGGNSAQRVRIGLTGLAFAFLLVLLGSIVSRSTNNEGAVNAAAQAAQNSEPSEPLAELGVAPGAPADANNSTSTAE
jgi:hypothetical protein